MSATGRDLVTRGEQYLRTLGTPNTLANWDALMDMVMSGKLDLDTMPDTRADARRAREDIAARAALNAA